MSRTELFNASLECAKSIMPSKMKGKTIMWWITVNAIGLWWYSAISGKALDGSIAVMYGTAVTLFGGGKIAETVQQAKSDTARKPEEVDV